MRQRLLTAILALILSAGTAFATDDNANTSSGEHPPFSCEKNDAGDFVCYCAGEADCQEMQDSGVCDVPMPELGPRATGNDTSCNDNFGNVGEYVCECTATSSAGVSRRPEAFNSPTENAPSERTNETVPARRGSAPAQAAATEEEGESEEATPRRRVRDHRGRAVQSRHTESEEERNRRIEEMRREAEALERQLQELEGGGG